MSAPSDEDIAAAVMAAVLERGRDKSICPSEVARRLAEDWRPLMPEVRRVAAAMTEVEATQKGVPIDAIAARGPIRLRLK